MIKLSIAIPTYNRANLLKNTIENITKQINFSNYIDIVISDNASNDNTKEIVDELQKKYSYIKYFRNETNLGFDKNCCEVVEKSLGEYVWLFGDDDALEEGALNKVYTTIKTHNNLALIYANWTTYDETLTTCLGSKVIPINQDMIPDKPEDFLTITTTKTSFISSLIIKRTLWCNIDKSTFIGTNWSHFGIILSLLKQYEHNYKSFIIAESLVKYRSITRWQSETNTASLDMGYVILPNILHDIEALEYSKDSIRNALLGLYRGLPGTIIQTRIKSNINISQKQINEITKNFSKMPLFWFMVFPLFYIPQIILPIFKLILQILKNIYNLIKK